MKLDNKILVNLKDKSYNIFIKKNILRKSGEYLKDLNLGKRILIVTQDRVPKLFINNVKANLKESGYKVFTIILG